MKKEYPSFLFPLMMSLLILGGMYYASANQKSIESWALKRKEELQNENERIRAECIKKKNHFLKEIPTAGGGSTPFCDQVIPKS